MAPLEIICGDITELQVEAIVCPAHKHLIRGCGVSAQIFDKEGDPLIRACKALDPCPIGEAVITPAERLPANYIIHTVTPLWTGGDQWGAIALQQLRQCYESAIHVARENQIRTLAFPALGAGSNKIPQPMAAHQALDVLEKYTDDFDRLVVCLFTEADRHIWEQTAEQFYDRDHEVCEPS